MKSTELPAKASCYSHTQVWQALPCIRTQHSRVKAPKADVSSQLAPSVPLHGPSMADQHILKGQTWL